MKLKLDNRAKDSIVKVLTLFGVILALTIILALVLDHLTPAASAAEETEMVTGVLSEMAEDVVVDDGELASPENETTSRADRPLIETEAGEDLLVDETLDKSEDTIGVGESISDFMESTIDSMGDFMESVGEFLFETEQQTEVIQETEPPVDPEVLMELKSVEDIIASYPYDEDKAVALAQLAWAEARGCSMREQSLVMWTVLNRVDVQYSGMTDFWSILTAPYQFAYSPNNPYEEYEYRIAVDVLKRWAAEKDGVEPSGRTLPKGYLYYYGDGSHNYFGTNGFGNELWFGLPDPYEDWAA